MKPKITWNVDGLLFSESSPNIIDWGRNYLLLILGILGAILAFIFKYNYGNAFGVKYPIITVSKLMLTLSDTFWVLIFIILSRTLLLSKKEPISGDEKAYQRHFKFPGKKQKIGLLAFILFILIFVFSTCFPSQGQNVVYFFGFIFILLFIRIIIDDFIVDAGAKYDLRYFYPSIISILILVYAVGNIDQFDTLFIELIRSPLNIFAFLILFLFSVNVIWFTPSTLRFTDVFDYSALFDAAKEKYEKGSKKRIKYWLLILKHSKYIFSLNKEKDESKKYIETNKFSLFCVGLGLFYVATLATLLMQVYLKSLGPEYDGYAIIITIASIVLPALYAHYLFAHYFGKKQTGKTEQDYELKKFCEDYENGLRKRSKKFNLRAHIIFIVVSAVFFGFVVYSSTQPFNNCTYIMIASLSILTVFFTIPFIKNVIFIHLEREKLFDFKEEGKNENTKTTENEKVKARIRILISLILFSNCIFVLVFLCAFVCALFFPFSWYSNFVENINALNIYLLFVNGFIAFIVVVDRLLTIKNRKDEYFASHNESKLEKNEFFRFFKKLFDGLYIGFKFFMYQFVLFGWFFKDSKFKNISKVRTSSSFWVYSIGLFLIAALCYKYLPNDYHTVPYNEDGGTLGSFEDYTNSFLTHLQLRDTTEESPIILIAADGGGLKSAFWTLKVLYHMDTLGLYDNIFMMSGISGGGIGEGIYIYLKSRAYSLDQINEIINKIGDTNFITNDLIGLLTRWPMLLIPAVDWAPQLNEGVESRQNRMEAMSEHYFDIIHEVANDTYTYDSLRKEPYGNLWEKKTDSAPLPLLIINTAKAEEGVKGWVHPFEKDAFFESGVEDLSRLTKRIDIQKNTDTSFISFPDAMFLTNRFPLLSPPAKIEGKGHFIDGGAVDNSGVETIAQVLLKLKSLKNKKIEDSFFQRKIIVVSIRNTRGRFIDSQFKKTVEDCFEAPKAKSNLNSNFSTILNTGLTGTPKKMDEIFTDGEINSIFNLEFIRIDLPTRLTREDIGNHFRRDISAFCEEELNKVDDINCEIYKAYKGNCDGKKIIRLVEPPLGRILSEPARSYMNYMLNYKDNKEIFDSLKRLNE